MGANIEEIEKHSITFSISSDDEEIEISEKMKFDFRNYLQKYFDDYFGSKYRCDVKVWKDGAVAFVPDNSNKATVPKVPTPKGLTKREVAKILGVSTNKVTGYIKVGLLMATSSGPDARITTSDLNTYIHTFKPNI